MQSASFSLRKRGVLFQSKITPEFEQLLTMEQVSLEQKSDGVIINNTSAARLIEGETVRLGKSKPVNLVSTLDQLFVEIQSKIEEDRRQAREDLAGVLISIESRGVQNNAINYLMERIDLNSGGQLVSPSAWSDDCFDPVIKQLGRIQCNNAKVG